MGSVALLIQAFFCEKRPALTYGFVQLVIVITAIATLQYLHTETIYTFSDMFVLDKFSVLLKLTMQFSVFVCFLYSRVHLKDNKMASGEYYILGLFSLLGMMVLVSAHHFLTLYLGLELMTLPIYAMVAMKRESGMGTEAAMKYFIMGALASGMLLYGLSLLYVLPAISISH